VCDKLRWDPARFQGFRCTVDYPIYGSQVTMVFQPPVSPEA
jgi:hypothetical protein